MRIIAGKYKGRKLATPTGKDIRPTLGHTREAIFNLLMHGQYGGDNIIDQHVLDLCCGTGAMGIEALSRGARLATFIDKDKRSLELARENVMHCGASNAAFFVSADATRLPKAREAMSLVLFDAPYDAQILASAYASLQAGGWLAPGTVIVAEQVRWAPDVVLEGAERIDTRTYGKATVLIYQVNAL